MFRPFDLNSLIEKAGKHWKLGLTILIVFALGQISAPFLFKPHEGPAARHYEDNSDIPEAELKNNFMVTPLRRQHILYGTKSGGGHKAGQGKPGESEFPASWDDEKIILTALAIANDATLPMRPSGRYWLKQGTADGIDVRVVLDRVHGELITAYPLNVPRNP